MKKLIKKKKFLKIKDVRFIDIFYKIKNVEMKIKHLVYSILRLK